MLVNSKLSAKELSKCETFGPVSSALLCQIHYKFYSKSSIYPLSSPIQNLILCFSPPVPPSNTKILSLNSQLCIPEAPAKFFLKSVVS